MMSPLLYLSAVSTLVPFAVSTLSFKDIKRQRDLFLLWLFWCLAAVVETVIWVSARMKLQNIWVFQIYSLLEYILILNLFKCWLLNERLLKWVRYAIPFYLVFFLLIKLTGLEPITSSAFNFVTRPIALLIIVFFIFKILFELWESATIEVTNDYRFWTLLALLVYYASSTALFAFSYVKDREILLAIFYTHAVLNIIHNLLFTIGIFKARGARQVAI